MIARFRVNTPNVVAEAFDDEMVLVNLDNGSYYTLDQAGLDIWRQIEQMADLDGICSAVASADDGNRADIEHAIRTFIETLREEGLIAAVEHDADLPTGLSCAACPVNGRPFTVPVLQRYTDMQELLLLDPIHEVDEAGWPCVKPDAAGQDV